MVRNDVVGTEGAPFDYRVEYGKVREFATAIQSSNPAYVDGDEPVCPPTFLTTANFLWQGPEHSVTAVLESDPDRSLHASQEFVFNGPPPRAGTRLTGRSYIAEVYEKEGRRGGTMTFYVLTTEFRDAKGTLVAESHLTGVETASAVNPEPGE